MTKETSLVGIKAAQTLYYAEQQAERIGFPLTISVTINISLLGICPRQAVATFRKLRTQRFSPWVRRPSTSLSTWAAPPVYSYGFENSRDGIAYADPDGVHNVHVHWAVHVPIRRLANFKNCLRSWVDEIAVGSDWPENAYLVRVINNPGKVARYPIKGAEPAVAIHYGTKPENIAPQGIILGRRTGTTRNIGPSARRDLDRKLGVRRRRMPKPK